MPWQGFEVVIRLVRVPPSIINFITYFSLSCMSGIARSILYKEVGMFKITHNCVTKYSFDWIDRKVRLTVRIFWSIFLTFCNGN